MVHISSRLNRIQPSPSSMAGQRARELRASGKDIVGLTAGEPDFDTPDNVKEAAWRAMQAGQTKYTDVGGSPELRQAIVDKFARENGLPYSTSEVIVCAGGKQVIFNALMCTLEPGDEVIIPSPYWVSYPDITLLADGVPVIVPCKAEHGFKLTPEDLDRAITPRTRWLVLNAPNNPSGAVYSQGEMKALTDVLLKHPHVWVLTDDIYEHVLFDGRQFVTPAQVEPELRSRTLTVNGLSKAYAMTGWRVGYGGGPAPLIKAMIKLQSQSTSNTSSIAQAAALEALRGPQDFIAERTHIFQGRRDRLVQALNAIEGVVCHSPEGAFYVFPSCERFIGSRTAQGKLLESSNDFVLYLLDSVGLAVLQGEAYGVPGHFRISFATAMDRIDEGCRRLSRAIAGLELAKHAPALTA